MIESKTNSSRQTRIETILLNELTPSYLLVNNESHRHQVPKHSETHFKVIAVTLKFEHLTRLARHRLINHLLINELNSGLHALSLHLYTPEEWAKSETGAPQTPACHKKPYE